jgi:kinesin family member 15
MWQYDSHAPAKVEDCSDEDFIKISEDVLKMHLELDIFKTILVEEKAAHAEVIDDLESDLVISIKESRELKKSNDQSLELLQKRDMEISRLNSELDICHKQEYLANEEPKMQTLKFYDAEASPLSTKLKRMQASLEKARNLNTRYQQDQASRSSAEQEKDEVRRQAEVETSEVILTLQQQLDASKQNELLTRENLDELQLEKNQLSDRLVEVMKENEHFSSVIEELSTNNSLLQSKLMRSNELANALSLDLRIVQESTSIAKDKADELTKVKASVILLERALSSKCLELEDVISERQQLEAQILKSNEKLAALEELGKQFDELNIVSMENAELKSQLKQIGRISYTAEELAHKSEITGKYEEDLIELRSLQNELSKLPVEKQCCEAQMLIFKRKLEMAQALIAESESIAAKAQQVLCSYLVIDLPYFPNSACIFSV